MPQIDKEAQKIIVNFLNIAQDIGSKHQFLDIWGNAETVLNELRRLNYRKIDLDNPPEVLSGEEIHKAGWVDAEFKETTNGVECNEIYDLQKILKAQRDDTLRKLLEG